MNRQMVLGAGHWPFGKLTVCAVLVCGAALSCSSDDPAADTNTSATTASTGASGTTTGAETQTAAANTTGVGGGGSTDVTAATGTTGGVEGPDVQVGLFSITLVPENESTGNPAHTSFQGQAREYPQPDPMQWDLADQSGDCELITPTIPFCDPGCGATGVCTEDGVCTPHAPRVSLGGITVSGVQLGDGASEFSLQPMGANFDYLTGASVMLSYPPFAEGDALTLSGDGGDHGSFTVHASGIAQLVVGGADPLPIDRDQPMPLEWTAASGGDSQIDIVVDVSHHGGVKGKIQCTVADSGSYTIEATLVTQLLDLGVAGYPIVKLSRRSTGSVRNALGRIDFQTISNVERELSIPGLTSCMGDDDCADGETCQTDRACG